MGDIRYSLMWDAYNKNMCKGLSLLQQHGEFVDMTLAADGHYVKVHKMVMSLVSPYIKDLISSADCPHPVIFLNQMSYETLTSLLEYVYTGQVSIAKDNLIMFMDACKSLHIKGFEKMDAMHKNASEVDIEEEHNTKILHKSDDYMHDYSSIFEEDKQQDDSEIDFITDDIHDPDDDDDVLTEQVIRHTPSHGKKSMIHYSLSNHGNLQLVHNRFVYNLKYASKRSGRRRWQCVDGVCKVLKCPARVTTCRNMVMGRNQPHNHPHHDKKILKKVEAGTIFTALHEAENQMHLIRQQKEEEAHATK